MKNRKLFLFMFFLMTIVESIWGQIPRTLSFQGILMDADDNLQHGQFEITFKLYEEAAGGTALWDETQAVNVDSGIYNVILGNISPLTLPFDKQYWVGISVNNDNELVPRIALTSSPYSFAVSSFPKPEFDSGWFIMESQAGVNSFKEITHDLGVYPSHVKVLVKAIDGNNSGFIFEGTGSQGENDDETNQQYGGVIFAYDSTRVRIWAPDVNNGANTTGRMISVHDGWGGEANTQASQTAEVKVLVWK